MTFSWWTFFFEAINFLVLAYILRRLLYRPLHDAIDKRKQANARAQVQAETARKDAESLKQRLNDQLAAVEQQRQQIIHEAHEQAESDRKKLLADGQRMVQRRQDEVADAIKREREQAITSLQGEIVTQAIELTRRLLSEASERSLHQQLALRLVQDLRQAPANQRELLQRNDTSGNGSVLEVAQDLDADTMAQLADAVSGVAGHVVTLALEHRQELLDGVRLRIGGQVWDCSLAGQLELANLSAGKGAQP